MNIYRWINQNRKEIDKYIQSPYKNDSERALWVNNDEYLYNCCRKNIKL